MKTVAVLHAHVPENASADEQDTLVQAEAVSRSLSRLGYEPAPVSFDMNLEAVGTRLRSLRPAFVFNLVESVQGLGKLIHLAPSLLDALGFPYTGASTEAMFLTSNKLVAKKLLSASRLATPPTYTLASVAEENFVKGRCIIKSVWEHASIGMNQNSVFTADSVARLRREINKFRKRFGGEWFCEQYIDGREFNLSVLSGTQGPEVLPPAEIRFDAYPEGKPRIVDYRAKWKPNSFEYRHTNRSFEFSTEDTILIERLKEVARACWKLFDLRGYARVDFRVDASGKPWILEVNANPCLAPDGGFPAAASRAGLSLDQVVERIIVDLSI
jgi:D-alanine-D-alanine ligase